MESQIIFRKLDSYFFNERNPDYILLMAIPDFTKLYFEKLCREFPDIDPTRIHEYIRSYHHSSSIPYRCDGSSSSSLLCSNDEQTILDIQKQIDWIRAQPQPVQRTPEWYLRRYNMITASDAWKAVYTEASLKTLCKDKCRGPPVPPQQPDDLVQQQQQQQQLPNFDSPTHWGQKYEPLSKMIYEEKYGCLVEEFGCIPHPEYGFLGASPDGIVVGPAESGRFGRMLEIKNVVSREITGDPKEEYWIQTQIQMEVCGLDSCDFLETRFVEITEDEYDTCPTVDHKGCILLFILSPSSFESVSQQPYVYKYFIDRGPGTAEEIEKMESQPPQSYTLYQKIFWKLDIWSCVFIRRNRHWFSRAIHKIRDAWNMIETERQLNPSGSTQLLSKSSGTKSAAAMQIVKLSDDANW